MCIITNKQNGKFSDFSSGLLRSARNDDVSFYSHVSRHCEERNNKIQRFILLRQNKAEEIVFFYFRLAKYFSSAPPNWSLISH